MAIVKRYRVWCSTDSKYVLSWAESPPTTCAENTAHAIDSNYTVAIETVAPDQVEITNAPSVQIRKPSGLIASRVYGFSVNFCDRTTWFHDAVEVPDEIVDIGDGVKTVFTLANNNVIDLSHGKVSDENDIANPAGSFRKMGSGYGTTYDENLSGYVPIVKLVGVEQVERGYGETTGGDYTFNYATGTITFFSAPTGAIECTYYYAPLDKGPKVVVQATPGTKFMISRMEVQASPDACPMSDILICVWAGPNLLARPTVIKNYHDIVSWARGGYPPIPAQGAAETRALPHEVNIHQIRYSSEIPLLSSAAMKIETTLSKPEPFAGTWATIVLYGVAEPE